MKYLQLLTEDEVRYICSVIPQSDAIDYFRSNPTDFGKISRGFRANTIARLDVGNLLYRNRNRDFISSFIEKHICNWVSQIEKNVNECIDKGDTEDLAYLHTLPYCPFAGNIALYFKLIEKELSEDYISLLSSAIPAIKEVSEKQEKSSELLKGKEAEIQQMKEKLECSQADLIKARTELDERLTEINVLKRTNEDLEKLNDTLKSHEKTIASLKNDIHEREETLKKLRSELSEAKDSHHQLEVQIRAELEKRQLAEATNKEATRSPKCPEESGVNEKYLSLLTEDDARYICSAIPQKDIIDYFNRNPKDARKISRGFRANIIARHDNGNILFRNREDNFVSSFIEKHISNWVSKVKENINECIEDGDTEDLAYLHTLPYCPFAGNIALYFKLIKKEISEDYISLLSSAISAIKEVSEKQEKSSELLKGKETVIQQMKEKLKHSQVDLDRAKADLNEHSIEIKALKHKNDELEKLKNVIETHEKIIASLKNNLHKREETIKQLRKDLADVKDSRDQLGETIKQLRKDLADVKDSRDQLEVQIRAELEKQRPSNITNNATTQRLKRPQDMDEFKDYLGYNLENIGIPTNSDYYSLLIDHLSCILFQGIPILINRGIGLSLMKCVANALTGTSNVKTLTYRDDLSVQVIDDFLSMDERILCLDNFIRFFDETLLLPLFESHRDKIIFLTVAYDRTLRFVPDEFLRYCHYLNLNRIEALSVNSELTEDPSTVEEIEFIPQFLNSDSRYSNLLKDMLSEFGVRQSLVGSKCAMISNEQDLCRALIFDILPYCIDVLQVAPYNTSDRFIKYAGAAGRCRYKDLLKRWYS